MAETIIQPEISTSFSNVSHTPTEEVDFSNLVGEWLSPHATMSAETSATIEQQELDETKDLSQFHEIGVGFCGHVFDSRNHSGVVFKRAKPDYYNDLRKDAEFHQKICAAIQEVSPELLRVPHFHSLIEAGDDWWSQKGHGFLATQNSRPPVLSSERILPLPNHARDSLVELFSPENEHERHKKRLPENTPIQEFRLRNFELTLEKFELLKIEKESVAKAIAQGLALMHWHAKCDARDVEFVLGTSRPPTKEDGTAIPFVQRTVHVWLLDFNQCREMTMDDFGIEKTASAFWDNDPYYPRPGGHLARDEDLWNCFKDEYVTMGRRLLSRVGGDTTLPERFIEVVIKRGKSRQQQTVSGPPKGPRIADHNRKEGGMASRRDRN